MEEVLVKNKMEVEPIKSLILKMSIPPLISMCMQYSYNLLDCIFVSCVSEKSLSAVSIIFPITTLYIAIAIWIGVGVSVLVAKYLGKMEYMDISVFMAIPCAVHICIQKVLQGTGNMLAPMCFQIAGVLTNLIFDPILIFGYFGFKSMGVKGAAIATVMGYTISTILAFLVLIFQKQKVKLGLKYFILRFNHIRDIFVVGFPSFIMNVLGAAMVYNTNLFLKQYSEIAIAFFGAYFKIQQMVIMTLNGLIQGCIPVMSYNYGAKREDRLKESLKIGTIVAIILTSFSIVMLWTFTKNILLTFNPPKEMFEFGIFGIRIMSLSYVFVGITTMIASYMQSTKNVGKSILINLCRQLLVLVPVMFIGSKIFGLKGIWSAFLITELICVIFSLVLYKNTKINMENI